MVIYVTDPPPDQEPPDYEDEVCMGQHGEDCELCNRVHNERGDDELPTG